MAYLKHDDKVYQVTIKPSGHIVTMEFLTGQPVVITTGFNVFLDPECKMLIGRYPEYKTVYRNDAETAKYNGYQLSDDGSVYVEPIPPVPVITFYALDGGELEGELKQEANNFEVLQIPVPVPDEKHKFVKWDPDIPESGIIESNLSFAAVFEYVPTLEEVKKEKVSELGVSEWAAIEAGTAYYGKVYLYGQSEQVAIKKALEVAVQTGESVSVGHTEGKSKLSGKQLKELYTALEQNEIYHKAYTGQLIEYVSAQDNEASVQAVFYGQALDPRRQELMDAEITSEMTVVNAYVEQLGYATAAEVKEISNTLEGLA